MATEAVASRERLQRGEGGEAASVPASRAAGAEIEAVAGGSGGYESGVYR